MQKLVDFFFISGLDEEYAFDADCGRADKKALEVDTLRVSSRRTSVHESNASASLDIPGEHSQQLPLRFIKNWQSRVFEDNDSFEVGVTTRATCTKITHGEKVQSLQASELRIRKSMYEFSLNEKSPEAMHMSSDFVVPRQPVLDQQPSIEPSQSHVRNGRRQSRKPIRQPSILSRKSSVSSALGSLRQELGDYVHYSTSESDGLRASANPLEQRFAPALLTRYPPQDAPKSSKFPSYLPMFAFPNDINIQISDERPRSTWHSFALTHGEGEALHGTCLTIWIPIARWIARQITARCEEWRAKNVDVEQEELNIALSSKLAEQKSCLSALLSKLTTAGVDEREALNEQIAQCEETIELYAELLKPTRKENAPSGRDLWMPRALGLLGFDQSQLPFWKGWLNLLGTAYLDGELQNVPSNQSRNATYLPLERYLINLFQEVPGPPTPKLSLGISIRGCLLIAEREATNELPGYRSIDLYPIFRALSNDNIIRLVVAALLESRIIFISKTTSMLAIAAASIISLIYPLRWQGIYIPLLPRRLLPYLEAPTPYMIGILEQYGHVELPQDDDVVVCDLDHDIVHSKRRLAFPHNIARKLSYSLAVSNPMHERFRVKYEAPAYCFEAFPANMVFTIPRQGPNSSTVVDLLAANTETFAVTKNMHMPKPCLNIYGHASSQQTKLKDCESRLPASRPVRPALTSSFSSFAASLRTSISKPKRLSMRHLSSNSTTTLKSHMSSPSMSSLATSLYATSSIVPPLAQESISSTSSHAIVFHEGHELQRIILNPKQSVMCDASLQIVDGSVLQCRHCNLTLSESAAHSPVLPCPASFDALKTRLAFVRAMAALLRDYRRALEPVVRDGRIQYTCTLPRPGFSEPGFLGQVMQTSAWHEFIHDACTRPNDEDVLLFTQILSLRNKGTFGRRGDSDAWLLKRPDQARRVFQVVPPNAEGVEAIARPRVPHCLDPKLFSTPRIARPPSQGTK